MLRHFHLNVLFAAFLLVIPLTAGVPSDGNAGGFEGPPPVDNATERLTGPAITGMVMITPENVGIEVEFNGRCGPVAVSLSFSDTAVAFEAVNLDTIKNFIENQRILGVPGLSDCYPPRVTDGRLIVVAVTRFTKDSLMATADLVILAAVLK